MAIRASPSHFSWASYATVPNDLFGYYSTDEEETKEWGYGELNTSTDLNDQEFSMEGVRLFLTYLSYLNINNQVHPYNLLKTNSSPIIEKSKK